MDNLGRIIPATGWEVSDGSVVEITSGGTPTLSALAGGQVTITGRWRELSAQAQVTVLEGAELPRGTVRWAVTPLPDREIRNIVQALPTGRGTPDLYSVERTVAGENVVRAFTSDGRQQWLSFIGASPLQSQAPLAVSALAAATTVSETIRGVAPSNSGGLLLSVFRVTFGDRILIENGLAMVDPETRGELWRFMTSNTLNARWALHPDGTIYVVESERSGANPRLMAFDGATGLVKFSQPLPLSSQLTISAGCVGQVEQTTFSPPQFGSPMVAPDGLVHLPVEVRDRVAFSRTCDGVTTSSSGYRLDLRLMQVSPDGSAAFSSLHFEEFLGTAPSPLVAPRAFPGELVPDGEGGILAAFAYARSDTTIVNEARVAHWTPNGVNEYPLPFVGLSGFGGERGLGTTEALVVGENGTAYATNLNKAVAFDMATGAVRWSWEPSDGFIEHVAAAAEGGLVMRNVVDFTTRIVRLDAGGQASYDAWTLQTGLGFDRFLDSIAPAWADAWLAVEFNSAFPNGALVSLLTSPVEFPYSLWARPAAQNTRAAKPKIKVRVFKVSEVAITVDFIAERVNTGIQYWAKREILLEWDGRIGAEPSCPIERPGCEEIDPQAIIIVPDAATAAEVLRRFPERKGITFLFTRAVFGSREVAGVPRQVDGSTGKEEFTNVVISGNEVGNVMPHEMGHVFRLSHVAFSPGNLMCGPLGEDAFEDFFSSLCTDWFSTSLTSEQVAKARQNAARLLE